MNTVKFRGYHVEAENVKIIGTKHADRCASSMRSKTPSQLCSQDDHKVSLFSESTWKHPRCARLWKEDPYIHLTSSEDSMSGCDLQGLQKYVTAHTSSCPLKSRNEEYWVSRWVSNSRLNYSLYCSAESSLRQVFTNGQDCFWDRDAIWSRAIYPCVNMSKHHHSFL